MVEDDNNSCRLCKVDGDIDIYTNSFTPYSVNEDVKLIDAYSLLASLNAFQVIDEEHVLRIMCGSCVKELITSYNFVMKIKEYDGRYCNDQDDFSGEIPKGSENNSLPSLLCQSNQPDHQLRTIKKEVSEPISSMPAENDHQNVMIINGDIKINDCDEQNHQQTDSLVVEKLYQSNQSNNEEIESEDNNLKLYEFNKSKRQKICTDNIEYDLSDIVVPKFVLNKQIVNRLEDFLLDPGCNGNINRLSAIPCDQESVYNDSTFKRTILTLNIEMINLNNVNFDEIDEIFDVGRSGVGGGGKNQNCDDSTMYMCKYCPKAFAGSYHLLMHTRRSHVCQFCVEGFPNTTQLHQHIRNEHKSFKCQICNKEFKANGNLRSHIRRSHQINLPVHVSLLVASANNFNNTINEKECEFYEVAE